MTTPQEVFPEIKTATDALEKRIAITESELVEIKESMATKKQLVRSLRKALAVMSPVPRVIKKKRVVSGATGH
jgi:hypothetical protein